MGGIGTDSVLGNSIRIGFIMDAGACVKGCGLEAFGKGVVGITIHVLTTSWTGGCEYRVRIATAMKDTWTMRTVTETIPCRRRPVFVPSNP